MTDYIAAYNDPKSPYHKEATKLAIGMVIGSTIKDGVMRWNSNNAVPFEDVLAFAHYLGMPVDVEASTKARDADTDAFLTEYRKARANHKHTTEELSEMRAAFGPGTVVVDVITGQKIKV